MLILYSHILIQLRDTTKRIKSARKRELDYKESTVTIWVAGSLTRTIYYLPDGTICYIILMQCTYTLQYGKRARKYLVLFKICSLRGDFFKFSF